jgi:hypothetical protein
VYRELPGEYPHLPTEEGRRDGPLYRWQTVKPFDSLVRGSLKGAPQPRCIKRRKGPARTKKRFFEHPYGSTLEADAMDTTVFGQPCGPFLLGFLAPLSQPEGIK